MSRWRNKILPALVIAAMTGLVGWVYTTGNRVTALEAKAKALDDQDHNTMEILREIHKDVREIRAWIMPER